MLVLTRERDQKIVIGSNIIVTVVDIRGDRVRLGIDAPREIPIHRLEIAQKIAKKQIDAALKSEGFRDEVKRATGAWNEYLAAQAASQGDRL